MLEKFIDRYFIEDDEGRRIFVLDGPLGNGYVIANEEDVILLRRFVIRVWLFVPLSLLPFTLPFILPFLLLPVSLFVESLFFDIYVLAMIVGYELSIRWYLKVKLKIEKKLACAEVLKHLVTIYSLKNLYILQVLAGLFCITGFVSFCAAFTETGDMTETFWGPFCMLFFGKIFLNTRKMIALKK